MGFALDMPDREDIANTANFLSKEGTYHFLVTHVDEQPVSKKDQSAVDGFAVEFSVLDGERVNGECPEKGKKMDLVFFNPKLNGADGGKWARAKQGAFVIAAGLVDETKCGQRIEIDLEKAVNSQVVATVQHGTDQAGAKKRFLELTYANIYHVDDPRAADCPKDAKALALIPKALRRDPASFKLGKDADASSKTSKQSGGKPAASGDDDLGSM